MPWSKTNTIDSLKNKSDKIKEVFAEAANSALKRGLSEEEAIFAGLGAVSRYEKVLDSVKKSVKPEIPLHLKAVLQAQEGKIQKAYLPDNSITSDSSRSLVSVDWDKQGRLVLTFDDGEKIVTSQAPIAENITQNFAAATLAPYFDFISFNSPTDIPFEPRTLSWNETEDCLDVMQQDGSTVQVGLEHYVQVYNNTVVPLENGTVVMFSGVHESEYPEATPLMASPEMQPLYLIGVMTNEVMSSSLGRATVFGKVRNLNTTGSLVNEVWNRGDLLWAHPTLPGKLTKVKPKAPNPSISIAAVLKVGATDGVILVRPTIFPRLFYAKYKSSISQQPLLVNTPYSVNFEITEIQSGVEIIDNSKLKVSQSGLYSFDFRLQITSTNSSQKNIYIWARINGVDVPESTTKVTLVGNAVEAAPSWNFVYSVNQNDYFELMYACDDTAIIINSPDTTSFCPGTPSAVIKVNQLDL